MRSFLIYTATLVLISINTKAQFADSLTISIGAMATTATKNYQPLWLTSNKFGSIADNKSDLSTSIGLYNIHRLATGKRGANSGKPWYVSYGAQLYNNNNFNSTFAQQAYVKAGYKQWQFRAGRFAETTGEMDAATSSGSLGISGNAVPIPKIGLALTEYTAVPFTKNFVKFKGQISHGWFNNNRYMKDALYHEKILYVQLGKKAFKLYAGVQHFVEWGGRRGNVQLDRSLKGFFDVLFVKQADDGSVGTNITGLPPNRPGDQRGLFEAGFTWDTKNALIHAYQQTPFETGRDVDIRNIDRLIGLKIVPKKQESFFKVITAELLYTYDMLGFVEILDRQSFYNNGFYKTGWENDDRIIGTPLFINRTRAGKYFNAYTPYNWNAPDNTIFGNDNIVNNRVVAAHIGTTYKVGRLVDAKTMFTYSINYGTHSTSSPFVPNKKQLYSLQQFNINIPKVGIKIHAAVAVDAGQLSDNVGFLLGFSRQFGPFASTKKNN